MSLLPCCRCKVTSESYWIVIASWFNLGSVAAFKFAFLTYGLTVSTQKTKVLVVGKDAEVHARNLHIPIRGVELETVTEFKYLRSIFTADNTIDKEVNHRIAKAGYAWHTLKVAKVWSNVKTSLNTKIQFFTCIVLSILLYGCETWSLSDSHVSRLRGFQMRCLSHICGVKRSALNHVTNESLLNTCQTVCIDKEIQ